MTENNGEVIDPKVLLSLISILLAFIIGIVNFCYTRSVQHEQNRRWDELNLANVALIDAGFLILQELPEQKALETDWGYKPLLFLKVKDRVFSDVVQIPYTLVLVSPVAGKKIEEIPHANFFFTCNEGKKEIQRLGLKKGQYAVMKRFEIQFNFKNIGRTIAKDLQIKIILSEPKNNEEVVFTQPIEMLPDMSANKPFKFWTSINSELPKNLKFELYIKYKDANAKEHQKIIPVSYDSNRDYWEYGR